MTLVLGVLNVTPDSFSDGGSWLDAEAAIAHGRELAEQGADFVDVGGESTRPGAERVPVEEELRRVLPVIEGLAAAGVPTSIDTMRADVAEQAVVAGATLINDVSGGRADERMFEAMAKAETTVILMHWRAHSAEMNNAATYADVVAEVISELSTQVDTALAAGVQRDQIVLDPGLGFAKNAEHNWELMRNLDALQAAGFPVLLGASRKRFLGELLGGREVEGREAATTAITTLAARGGVWGVRVHDVRAARDAIAVVDRWEHA